MLNQKDKDRVNPAEQEKVIAENHVNHAQGEGDQVEQKEVGH